MTREEQILNKAIDYSEIEENFLEYDDCGDVCNDKNFIGKAFIEGAKWADEHPNINSLWHTPDEVPQYNKKLVTHCDEKMEWNPINHTIYYDDPEYPWDELVKIYNILHWAYAKDLVPNFNEDF